MRTIGPEEQGVRKDSEVQSLVNLVNLVNRVNRVNLVNLVNLVTHLSMGFMGVRKDPLELVQLDHARVVTKPVEGRIDNLLEHVVREPEQRSHLWGGGRRGEHLHAAVTCWSTRDEGG